MYTPSEQFSEIAKSQLTPPITIINGLAQRTFTQIEKIIALNIATSKISLQESNNVLRKLLGVTDPQEFLSLTIMQLGSNIERMRSYSHNLIELAEKTIIEPIQNAEETPRLNTEGVSPEAPPPAIVDISQMAAPAADEPIESRKMIEHAVETKAEVHPDLAEKEPAVQAKVEATPEALKKGPEYPAKPVPQTAPAPIKTAAAHTHSGETRQAPKITRPAKNKAGNKRK